MSVQPIHTSFTASNAPTRENLRNPPGDLGPSSSKDEIIANSKQISEDGPHESCLSMVGSALWQGLSWTGQGLQTIPTSIANFAKNEWKDVVDIYNNHAKKSKFRAALYVIGKILTAAAIVGAFACPIVGGIFGTGVATGLFIHALSPLACKAVGIIAGALAGYLANVILAAVAREFKVAGTHGKQGGNVEDIATIGLFTLIPMLYVGRILLDVAILLQIFKK